MLVFTFLSFVLQQRLRRLLPQNKTIPDRILKRHLCPTNNKIYKTSVATKSDGTCAPQKIINLCLLTKCHLSKLGEVESCDLLGLLHLSLESLDLHLVFEGGFRNPKYHSEICWILILDCALKPVGCQWDLASSPDFSGPRPINN